MGRLHWALVLSAKYHLLSEILFPSQNRGRLLSERYLPPAFRCFCIHHPGTALLYKPAPRHHRFHTCGLLFIVRHVQQQYVEVLEHIQVVCLCGFYQAVDDGTGSSALYRIVEKEVLSPCRIGFRTPLGTISEYSDIVPRPVSVHLQPDARHGCSQTHRQGQEPAASYIHW